MSEMREFASNLQNPPLKKNGGKHMNKQLVDTIEELKHLDFLERNSCDEENKDIFTPDVVERCKDRLDVLYGDFLPREYWGGIDKVIAGLKMGLSFKRAKMVSRW